MDVLAAIALGIVAGCTAAGIGDPELVVAPRLVDRPLYLIAMALLGIVVHVVLLRGRGTAALSRSAKIQALITLPIWGFMLNHMLPSCGSCGPNRLFAEPAIYGIFAAHALAALAYWVARERPEALRPWPELTLHALLLLGVVVDLAVTIQLLPLYPYVLIAPLGATPLLTPPVAAILLLRQLRRRLHERGVEARAQPNGPRPTLRLWLASPLVLGAYAVVHALWLHAPRGALFAFTEVCSGTFSTLKPAELGCHYLCTVAAQGHPWLVRPERLGRRRGATIIVNRQLAVANAFEDLLHERWPRFGRLARRTYDRLGLPVSRLLRRRWLADVVYVAMKPAEWAFYLVLLLVDRRDPEARIDRMYR